MAIIPRQSLSHGYNKPFFDSFIDAASFLALEPTDDKSKQGSEGQGSEPQGSEPQGSEPQESLPQDSEPQDSLPSNSHPKHSWTPTPEAFNKLLGAFSPDRDVAAEEYERIKVKLLRFFEWRGCHEGDKLTDEVFDRVMRKLDEGLVISNIKAFIYTVAKYVLLEWRKKETDLPLTTETVAPAVDPKPLESEADDRRVRCFNQCLADLPKTERETLLEYYASDEQKIESRTKLAEKHGITPNALRIRVHRIRKKLEKAVKTCVGQTGTDAR